MAFQAKIEATVDPRIIASGMAIEPLPINLPTVPPIATPRQVRRDAVRSDSSRDDRMLMVRSMLIARPYGEWLLARTEGKRHY